MRAACCGSRHWIATARCRASASVRALVFAIGAFLLQGHHVVVAQLPDLFLARARGRVATLRREPQPDRKPVERLDALLMDGKPRARFAVRQNRAGQLQLPGGTLPQDRGLAPAHQQIHVRRREHVRRGAGDQGHKRLLFEFRERRRRPKASIPGSVRSCVRRGVGRTAGSGHFGGIPARFAPVLGRFLPIGKGAKWAAGENIIPGWVIKLRLSALERNLFLRRRRAGPLPGFDFPTLPPPPWFAEASEVAGWLARGSWPRTAGSPFQLTGGFPIASTQRLDGDAASTATGWATVGLRRALVSFLGLAGVSRSRRRFSYRRPSYWPAARREGCERKLRGVPST